MKNLIQVNTEIAELASTDMDDLTKMQKNRIKKRMSFLKLVKMYLETVPEEHYLTKEKKRLSSRLTKINDGFMLWQKFNQNKGEDLKKQRQAYDREMETKKVKEQLKTVSFILS